MSHGMTLRRPLESARYGSRLGCTAALVLLCVAGCGSNPPRFEIGIIGDAPYTAQEEEKFPRVIAAMNAADLAFVVHVGDLQVDARGHRSGAAPCLDATLAHRKALLDASRHPVVVTPGDNDWTDCRYAKPPLDPISRLDAFRGVFFSSDRVLGGRSLNVTRQNADPAFSKFAENLRWVREKVLFATIHVVGSNNNRGHDAASDAEYAERNAANLAWVRQAFAEAKQAQCKAVVIFTQANPQFEDEWPPPFRRFLRVGPPVTVDANGRLVDAPTPSGFHDIVVEFAAEAASFGKPVLFVHGDTHYFRVDKPVWDPFAARHVTNVTRVETFGSPLLQWIRVTIDPDDPNPFAVKPELMSP